MPSPEFERKLWRLFAVLAALTLALFVFAFWPRTTVFGNQDEDWKWDSAKRVSDILVSKGVEPVLLDASPLGESQWAKSKDQLVVIRTNLNPTRAYGGDDEIRLYVLDKGAADWFKAHPTMPAIPTGKPVLDTIDEIEGVGADLDEFFLTAWDRSLGTVGDSQTRLNDTIVCCGNTPGWEPRAEREARSDLYSADLDGTVIGQQPEEGSPLRPGQLMVLLVKPAPPPPPAVGSSGSFNVPNRGFEFPDKLCPTRFC